MISDDLPVVKSDEKAGQKTWDAERTHTLVHVCIPSFLHSFSKSLGSPGLSHGFPLIP